MNKVLLAAAVLSAFTSSAFSQITLLDEITVTSQKRNQNIKDVPIAITAFTQHQLKQLGVQQFDDLADFVPSLEVQEQSANNPSFVIRGITSDSGDATIEPRVSIYQDGVSISRSRGSFIEIFDSAVEVVRGPQPTLFGRSALIGAINMTSNKADTSKQYGSIKFGAGNFEYRLAEATLNAPLIDDQLAVRVAGRYKARDGYIENLIGGDLNGFETFAGRIAILARPNEALSVNLIANIQRDNNPGTGFKSGTFFPAPSKSISPFSAAALSTFGGFHNNRDLGLKRDVNSVTLLVDYPINDKLTLSSISNYRDFYASEVYDPDGFALELFSFAENTYSRQFSHDIRLGFELNDTLSGFIGISYFDEAGAQNVNLGINEVVLQGLLGGFLFTNTLGVPQNPLPLFAFPSTNADVSSPLFGAPLGVFSEEVTNFGDTQSSEFFADATYSVSNKLDITAGVRFSSDNKTSGLKANASIPSNLSGVGLLIGTAAVSGGRPIERDQDFDATTWRLAATYTIDDNISLFANFARGRRPEVIAYNLDANDLSVLVSGQLADNFEVLPAEDIDALDLGIKGDFFNSKLYAELSAYIYDYTNFQTTVLNNSGQIQSINAGNASGTGLEATLFGKLTSWAELFAMYAYTDTRFDNKDDAGNRQVFAGNRFRLTPEHSFTVGGRFSHVTDIGRFTFSPVYAWKSKLFFANDNDLNDSIQDEIQNSYAVLDLRLSYTDNSNTYSIELFAENALNKDYLLDAGNVGDTFGIATFIAAPPAIYGLSFSANF